MTPALGYDGPIYVEPFLGAGAVWLALLGLDLVPLVSWMGGKRRETRRILRVLGLAAGRMLLGHRVGERIPCLLGDASWWGWVWPVVLDHVEGPRVEAFLRSWRAEDPRALWFRLRDLGPITDDVAAAAAQLLWLQARAASGVPVWWEGAGTWVLTLEGWRYLDAGSGDLVQDRGWKSATTATRDPFPATQAHASLTKWDRTRVGNRGPANQAHAAEPTLLAAPGDGRERQVAYERSRSTPRLLQEASTQVDDAGQRQARDPRLIAGKRPGDARDDRDAGQCHGAALLASDGRGDPREAGHKGTDTRGGGGIVDPGTIAARADAIRARLVKASGGEAGLGGNDGWRRKHGCRLFEPGDVADRAARVRGAAVGDTSILHTDARTLTEEYSRRIGAAGRVYLDPPYRGKTGYPATCPREDVLWIAETWARAGARVVLSEANGLAGELGSGWIETELREGEWITCYGVESAAVLGTDDEAQVAPVGAA
jgi:hypothetical protein